MFDSRIQVPAEVQAAVRQTHQTPEDQRSARQNVMDEFIVRNDLCRLLNVITVGIEFGDFEGDSSSSNHGKTAVAKFLKAVENMRMFRVALFAIVDSVPDCGCEYDDECTLTNGTPAHQLGFVFDHVHWIFDEETLLQAAEYPIDGRSRITFVTYEVA